MKTTIKNQDFHIGATLAVALIRGRLPHGCMDQRTEVNQAPRFGPIA